MRLSLFIALIRLVGKQSAGGYSIIIRRDIFNKSTGFPQNVTHAEDIEFIQGLGKKGIALHVLRYPTVVHNFRRFHAEGYLTVIWYYVKSYIYVQLYGSIKNTLFDYPMGGSNYLKKSS